MKKGIIFLLLAFPSLVVAQFGASGTCNWNVNDPDYHNNVRKPVIDATFKWYGAFGKCTGTLINRDVGDGELGFYFLTARHCVAEDNFDPDSPIIDFNEYFNLAFNYQSEGASNGSTHTTNHGNSDIIFLNGEYVEHSQSNLYSTFPFSEGYEYFHRTRLELIDYFFWGDFALVKIVTPLPPHFNVTYSGWCPSPFFNGFLTGTSLTAADAFVGIHHPRGDIKKVHGANHVEWFELATATTCYSITTVIDVLFGWMWGNSQSTQVICNYVDNPWVVIPQMNFGSHEPGSSGSGLFNTGNQLIGVLSGLDLGDYCETQMGITAYGKLRASYFNASIRDVMNPSHDIWVDLNGLDSRKISCYNNLNLPGVSGVSGQYFPASHYQANNAIVLQAANNIDVTQPIVVYPDADYTFRAGYDITGDNNIDVEVGANFTVEIAPCSSERLAENSHLDRMLTRLSESTLPKKKVFDRSAYRTPKQEQERSVLYPNPTTGLLTLSHRQQILQLEVYDAVGRRVLQSAPNTNTTTIDLSGNAAGIYTVRVTLDDGKTETHKVIRQH